MKSFNKLISILSSLCVLLGMSSCTEDASYLSLTKAVNPQVSSQLAVQANEWKSLGMCSYTDDVIAPIYKKTPVTYDVEIQEHTQRPGLYRLVNAYGAAYPYNKEGDWDASKNYYIEINAEDPLGVYITRQNTGLDWGQGYIYIYSLAAQEIEKGETLEDTKLNGYCGTLINGVISFYTDTVLWSFESTGTPIFTGNKHGAFKIVLPTTATQAD